MENLLARMTLDEKLQQIQLSDGQVKDEDARKGVGSVFSLVDPVRQPDGRRLARPALGGASPRPPARTRT